MATLVREHGLGYLVAAVILGGFIQVILARLGVARLMRFSPRSVMVGFVNALAILIFAAQVPHLLASSNDLVYQFDYANDPNSVVIDMTNAHIWDASSVAALDAITTKYTARGKNVEIIELNKPSARMHGTLAGRLNVGH